MEPVLFRFEKFDFTKCEVHVSCPHCFALSKWPIASPVQAFECPCCPFSGGVRLGPAAIEEYQAWRTQCVKAVTSSSGNTVYGDTIVGRKCPPPLSDHQVDEFYKNAYQDAAAAIRVPVMPANLMIEPKGTNCSSGPRGAPGPVGPVGELPDTSG